MNIEGNHNNLYLSVGSCIGSIMSFFVAFVTDYHIMGLLGLVCVVVSIWAGVLTIKEKRLSMRIMKGQYKNKSGGHR